MGVTSPSEEQTQVILNLGDRAHRGTGVVARGLLIDRNSRGQAFDRIDIRLIDLAEELTGVSRQTLDITALTFGKDRVERQRALAAPTHTGEHHHLVARNGDIHVFEIVLARSPHPDHILIRPSAQADRLCRQ